MSDYITPADLYAALAIDETDDSTASIAISAASRFVDNACGRNFSVTTSAARYFFPVDSYVCQIDDAATVTAVATDDGNDGTYSTSWSTTDWQAQPVGGIGPNALTGWPYLAVVAVLDRCFLQQFNRRPSVKVTGTWGWTAVPEDVKLATLMLAEETFKAVREAPLGSINLADFGPSQIRGNRRVEGLLAPYARSNARGGDYLIA